MLKKYSTSRRLVRTPPGSQQAAWEAHICETGLLKCSVHLSKVHLKFLPVFSKDESISVKKDSNSRLQHVVMQILYFHM